MSITSAGLCAKTLRLLAQERFQEIRRYCSALVMRTTSLKVRQCHGFIPTGLLGASKRQKELPQLLSTVSLHSCSFSINTCELPKGHELLQSLKIILFPLFFPLSGQCRLWFLFAILYCLYFIRHYSCNNNKIL